MLKLLLMENGGGEEPLSWVAWKQAARLNLLFWGPGQLRLRVSS